MFIVESPLSRDELQKIAQSIFGDFVKGVVDVEKELLVLDAELHADEEAFLIEKGSSQKDLWGINLYPEVQSDDWIEFDSMINLKPRLGNRSRSVEDLELQAKIIELVNKKILK